MKINIAGGSGIMGQVHKPIFERAGHQVIISGRNSSPSLEEAAKLADLTIVSVPIPNTIEIIKKVAPYCKALMDFTGLKEFPIKAMLAYSPENCEVGGLHPLYKEFSQGRTVVYCPTNRGGVRCREIVDCLENAGAKIRIMQPQQHDKAMACLQNLRIRMLGAYAQVLRDSGMDIKELYELAPPNTKPVLDLIARQVNSENDELFRQMCEFNLNTPPTISAFVRQLIKADAITSPEQVREFFGSELKPAQERAKKLI